MFRVDFGVRQASVLSPYLFAIYMDDLVQQGQFNRGMFIILYADDILLIAPSIRQLQDLLLLCESELSSLEDLEIKLHVPPCCSSGASLPWVCHLRYLGMFIFIICSRVFKISLDHTLKEVFIVQQMLYFWKSW